MNFLGHAYFTEGSDEVLAGNVFGDYIKGKIENHNLPQGIKNGLRLHRQMDALCDESKAYRTIRDITGAEYGRFKGIIADVFIDHLLSVYWDEFSEVTLEMFAGLTYSRVARSRPFFPPDFIRMFEYMQKDNWFVRNRDLQTISNILKRIELRFQNTAILHTAVPLLQKHREVYRKYFFNFLDEMHTQLMVLK